jgi:hypothetical protein
MLIIIPSTFDFTNIPTNGYDNAVWLIQYNYSLTSEITLPENVTFDLQGAEFTGGDFKPSSNFAIKGNGKFTESTFTINSGLHIDGDIHFEGTGTETLFDIDFDCKIDVSGVTISDQSKVFDIAESAKVDFNLRNAFFNNIKNSIVLAESSTGEVTGGITSVKASNCVDGFLFAGKVKDFVVNGLQLSDFQDLTGGTQGLVIGSNTNPASNIDISNVVATNFTGSGPGEQHAILCDGENFTISNIVVQDFSNPANEDEHEPLYFKVTKATLSDVVIENCTGNGDGMITFKGGITEIVNGNEEFVNRDIQISNVVIKSSDNSLKRGIYANCDISVSNVTINVIDNGTSPGTFVGINVVDFLDEAIISNCLINTNGTGIKCTKTSSTQGSYVTVSDCNIDAEKTGIDISDNNIENAFLNDNSIKTKEIAVLGKTSKEFVINGGNILSSVNGQTVPSIQSYLILLTTPYASVKNINRIQVDSGISSLVSVIQLNDNDRAEVRNSSFYINTPITEVIKANNNNSNIEICENLFDFTTPVTQAVNRVFFVNNALDSLIFSNNNLISSTLNERVLSISNDISILTVENNTSDSNFRRFVVVDGSATTGGFWTIIGNVYKKADADFYSSIVTPSTLLIRENYGYVTENQGVSSVSNGDTFAHGCVGAPTYINLTTTVKGHIASVSNVTATHLTIELVDSSGNNVTVDEDLYWEAKIR